MEWNGRLQEWNGKQSSILVYQFHIRFCSWHLQKKIHEYSSLHKIFEKGGKKFRKFENNEDHNENFPAHNQVRFSCPNLGEGQKKGFHSNLQNLVFGTKKKVFAHRFCAQTFCPSYNGKNHATILHTTLC